MMRLGGLCCILIAVLYSSCAVAAVDVFVSIPPQKWLVKTIGGELVDVAVLVKEGQDPHTFEPTPREMASLSAASLWFVVDMDFENQLQRRVEGIAPALKIVDISDPVEKLEMSEAGEGQHKEEHATTDTDDHDHGHGHDHDADEHDGQRHADPHTWLSPPNLKLMAEVIVEALSHEDPDNASIYSKRLEDLRQLLDELHQEIGAQLEPFRGASFYVFHPSFGYFANTYGLQQHAVETGGKSPTPRQLASLITRARADNVNVVFVQPQFDPKSARAIASAIDGEVVPLDALAEDIPGNLRQMARKIQSALSP